MAAKVGCFRVEFLYDVVCPYSWIGYKMLQSRRTRWEEENIRVEFIPVRKRKLLTLSKVESLLSMVPSKQQYIFHELKALARQYHIEIKRPELCREIGFEFRDCDDLVSRIQLQSNANDVMQTTKCAAEEGVCFAHFLSYSQCSIPYHFTCVCFAHFSSVKQGGGHVQCVELQIQRKEHLRFK
uniref:DSBA domain-containing protein n=1 Tax=Ascaris lumbricoides TaxID=6252 RepID=A0A0M3HPF1_ASCLU